MIYKPNAIGTSPRGFLKDSKISSSNSVSVWLVFVLIQSTTLELKKDLNIKATKRTPIENIISSDKKLNKIAEKIISKQRLSFEDGIDLFETEGSFLFLYIDLVSIKKRLEKRKSNPWVRNHK